MSKAAIWAAMSSAVAMALIWLEQWLLALAVVAIGGAGYVLARAIEDVLARNDDPFSRPR